MRDNKPATGFLGSGRDPILSNPGPGDVPSADHSRPVVRPVLLVVLVIVALATVGVWQFDAIRDLITGGVESSTVRRGSSRGRADGLTLEESPSPAAEAADGAAPRRPAHREPRAAVAVGDGASRKARDSNTPTAWPPLRLQGIIAGRSPEHSTALINGKCVKIGETIDGVRVQAIHTNRVDLVMEGTVRTLFLGQSH